MMVKLSLVQRILNTRAKRKQTNSFSFVLPNEVPSKFNYASSFRANHEIGFKKWRKCIRASDSDTQPLFASSCSSEMIPAAFFESRLSNGIIKFELWPAAAPCWKHLNIKFKQHCARTVLGWYIAWELMVLLAIVWKLILLRPECLVSNPAPLTGGSVLCWCLSEIGHLQPIRRLISMGNN